jgi:hypothetical protein
MSIFHMLSPSPFLQPPITCDKVQYVLFLDAENLYNSTGRQSLSFPLNVPYPIFSGRLSEAKEALLKIRFFVSKK